MARRQGVERAVVQQDRVGAVVRLEAQTGQRADQVDAALRERGAEGAALLVGVPERGPVGLSRIVVDSCRKDLGDELVAAFRDGDRDAVTGRLVDLRGSATPARPIRWCRIAGEKQAGVNELVEVERGESAGHPGGVAGLVPADRVPSEANVLVEGPAG